MGCECSYYSIFTDFCIRLFFSSIFNIIAFSLQNNFFFLLFPGSNFPPFRQDQEISYQIKITTQPSQIKTTTHPWQITLPTKTSFTNLSFSFPTKQNGRSMKQSTPLETPNRQLRPPDLLKWISIGAINNFFRWWDWWVTIGIYYCGEVLSKGKFGLKKEKGNRKGIKA